MKITSKNNELMDPCNGTHSLINIQPEDKLRYISLITPEAITFSTHRETLKKIERIREENAYDDYIEDEHKQKLRKRNPENWKQNVRKRNKNKGN